MLLTESFQDTKHQRVKKTKRKNIVKPNMVYMCMYEYGALRSLSYSSEDMFIAVYSKKKELSKILILYEK